MQPFLACGKPARVKPADRERRGNAISCDGAGDEAL